MQLKLCARVIPIKTVKKLKELQNSLQKIAKKGRLRQATKVVDQNC